MFDAAWVFDAACCFAAPRRVGACDGSRQARTPSRTYLNPIPLLSPVPPQVNLLVCEVDAASVHLHMHACMHGCQWSQAAGVARAHRLRHTCGAALPCRLIPPLTHFPLSAHSDCAAYPARCLRCAMLQETRWWIQVVMHAACTSQRASSRCTDMLRLCTNCNAHWTLASIPQAGRQAEGDSDAPGLYIRERQAQPKPAHTQARLRAWKHGCWTLLGAELSLRMVGSLTWQRAASSGRRIFRGRPDAAPTAPAIAPLMPGGGPAMSSCAPAGTATAAGATSPAPMVVIPPSAGRRPDSAATAFAKSSAA